MPLASIEVPGKHSMWRVAWQASQEQIDAMREDGIDVGVVENIIPEWVVDLGLLRFWCFWQDVWNFKNPWKNR